MTLASLSPSSLFTTRSWAASAWTKEQESKGQYLVLHGIQEYQGFP